MTDNGTVYMVPGTYHENLQINKKLSLINYDNAFANPVIIDGDYNDNTME